MIGAERVQQTLSSRDVEAAIAIQQSQMLLRDDGTESKIAVAFFGGLREFRRRYGAPPRESVA